MVPEEWETAELTKRSIAVIDGDRGKNYPGEGEIKDTGHCLFLSAKNVALGGFAFSQTQFISENTHRAMRKGVLERGDLVLTTRGTVGNVALYDHGVPFEVVRINSGMVVIRNRDAEVSTDFLYLLFRSFVIQDQVKRLTFGSAQPQLTVGIINRFDIPLPPLPEQQKIAEILSTWDKAIETTEALLANARTQKRALMQTLLTGTRRFPGFEAQPWREVRLGDVCQIRKGDQKSKSTLGSGGQFPVINGGVSPSGYSDEWNTEAGTITISEGGNSCGFANLINVPFWSGGHCYTLENLQVNRDYLFHWLKFREAEVMALRVGSGLPNIQKKAITNFTVRIVSDKEQGEIAGSINCALGTEATIEAQLDHLRTEKKSLMQQLLTGKRRVVV